MARPSTYRGEFFAMREDLIDLDIWEDWVVLRLYLLLCLWSQRSKNLGKVRFTYGKASKVLAGKCGNRNVEPGTDALRRALKVLEAEHLIHVPDAPWRPRVKGDGVSQGDTKRVGRRGYIDITVYSVRSSRAVASRDPKGVNAKNARGSQADVLSKAGPLGGSPTGNHECAGAKAPPREAGPQAPLSNPPQCVECLDSGPPGYTDGVANPAAYGPGTRNNQAEFTRPLCTTHAFSGGRSDAPLAGAAVRSRGPGSGLSESEQELRTEVVHAFLMGEVNTKPQVSNGTDTALRAGTEYLQQIGALNKSVWNRLVQELGTESPEPGPLLRTAAPDDFDTMIFYAMKKWRSMFGTKRDGYVRTCLADQLKRFVKRTPADQSTLRIDPAARLVTDTPASPEGSKTEAREVS